MSNQTETVVYSKKNIEEAIGKRILEVVESWDGDDMFYVGSKSGFLFIGTKGELIDGLHKVSDQFKNLYRDEYEKSKAFLTKEIYKPIKPKEGETLKMYSKRLGGIANRIAHEEDVIQTLYKRVSTFKDMENRKIKDIYEKILPEEPGIAIIIEGFDVGKYWSLAEYKDKNFVEPKDEDQE